MSEIENYIRSRIMPRIKYYSVRTRTYKLITRGIRFATSIMSIVVLFLINVEQVPRLIVSLIAALVALLVSIENIGKFESLWHSYRLTKEAIEAEVQLYNHRAGPYVQSVNDANTLFVERTEGIMSLEARRWHSIILAGKGSSSKDDLIIR